MLCLHVAAALLAQLDFLTSWLCAPWCLFICPTGGVPDFCYCLCSLLRVGTACMSDCHVGYLHV